MFHKEEFTLDFFSSQWISGNKALTPQNSLERDTDCTVCSIKKKMGMLIVLVIVMMIVTSFSLLIVVLWLLQFWTCIKDFTSLVDQWRNQ